MKKGKYLITGCAGFIGSHVVHDLYKKYNLILVDDLSEGKLVNLPKALRGKLIKKKIQDIKNLRCGGLKGIIHLAAGIWEDKRDMRLNKDIKINIKTIEGKDIQKSLRFGII